MINNKNLGNLASQCGLYCGACRGYLLEKKNLFEEKRYKKGCKGCIIQNKNCSFIKRDCPKLRKKEIRFCFECKSFPCPRLKKIEKMYITKYNLSAIGNLKRIKNIGITKWLEEQNKLYTCPECGGEICVHDAECYDCGYKINPNIK
ncbi:MAG: DUF3795 domain-containing protein [Promethearchaeota archaeon]